VDHDDLQTKTLKFSMTEISVGKELSPTLSHSTGPSGSYWKPQYDPQSDRIEVPGTAKSEASSSKNG
jgi:hypothetical protein